MSWIEISEYASSGWADGIDVTSRARHYCAEVEKGQILFFRQPPFVLPEDDRNFLVNHKACDSRLHKNISYRPGKDLLRGFSDGKENQQRVHRIMRDYSSQVAQFVSRFLAPYAGKLLMDFASFRPLEEDGRNLPLHKKNDLLHVDAFPSRPTRGGRILRVFTNVNPSKGRVWFVTDRFPALARKFASDDGLKSIAVDGASNFAGRLTKERLEFPPMATWLVYTDGVPHAALSGQFAMEQTFIVPVEALVAPEHAPIRVLEGIYGKKLA